ncbi:MAG: hypothetical protein K6F50_10605, partial [Kiritimatiellae bacterium]|nr:hypothetical protein [Kiritimatiellia bacterium]
NLDFIDFSPASTDMDAAAALPYGYVEEDAQRMGFMKRFAEAMDLNAVKSLEEGLKDRFGPLPAPAKRLAKLAALKVKCAQAGINHVDVKGTRAVFYRTGSRAIAFVRDLHGKKPDRKIGEIADAVAKVSTER